MNESTRPETSKTEKLSETTSAVPPESPAHVRTATDLLEERLDRPIRAAVFASASAADRVLGQLLDLGFTRDQITVVCSDEAEAGRFKEFEHQDPAGSHTPEAGTTGAILGATIGGLATVAGLMTTGGAAVLATGGIAAWAGGVVGGLVGAMMTRGVEKELANFYDQAVTQGKILVAVEPRDDADQLRLLHRAERVMAEGGAEPLPLPPG